MRKVNKILMATVSILLCLVLISTSVVSGIFAKYAINNKGSASATFKAFGVTLEMTVDETKLINAGAKVVTDEDKHKVTKSVTITGLKMAPGLNLDKIINIELSGTPTVDCRFKLDIDFDFDAEKFIIPKGECGVTSSNGELHFPIYLTFGRIDNSDEGDFYRTFKYRFTSSEGKDGEHEVTLYEYLMLDLPSYDFDSAIYFDKIGGSYVESEKKYVDAHLYRDFEEGVEIFLNPSRLVDITTNDFIFEPDESLSFNNFDLGFNWPEQPSNFTSNRELYDAYIANNNPDGLDFTYKVTVSVEQIIPE